MIALPGGYGGGKRDLKYAFHAWTSRDNPFSDKEYIARLEKLLGKEYAKQELEGLFTDAIGYVFPTFDRTKHMGKPPSEDPAFYETVVGGIDPGFTDPYAGCVWAKTKEGVWWMLWELYETQQTSDDLAPLFLQAQERYQVKRWYCDKRRPSDIKDLRRSGVSVVPNLDVYHETDRSTIKPMLAVLQGLMERDRMMLRDTHERTADEFERYHYDVDDDKERNTNDIPVDWMNHLTDATRYAIAAVEDLTHAAPRYRQGLSQHPEPVEKKGPKTTIPSLSQSISWQDEKLDTKENRELGLGRRRHAAHFLRRRVSRRGELL
jgi:phage terminase large subunit